MYEQTIDTSATPHIAIIECLGDLVVQGSDEAKIIVRVDGEADDLSIEREGETLTLDTRVGCQLMCPTGATFTARTVRGDLAVKGVNGPVTIGSVNGDATLRASGPATLEQVFGDLNAERINGRLQVQTVNGDTRVRQVEGEASLNTVHGNVVLRSVGSTLVEQISGDLSARRVAGDLRVGQVQGDAHIRQVDGQFILEQAGSDLRAEGIHGGVTVNQVGADVWLNPPFAPGATYRVNAGGDVEIRLPKDASLHLSLRAGGRIRSLIPGLALQQNGAEAIGVIGAGEATLETQAGGQLVLRPLEAEDEAGRDFDIDLDFLDALKDLGPMIEAQIAEAMANVQVRLQEGLSRMDSEQIRAHVERAAEHARRAAERAAEQTRREAERAAEQVRRQAEREAERARIRAERAQRRWQRASGTRARQETAATDEERLRVLRMLEQGKITPEQANELLAALEGR